MSAATPRCVPTLEAAVKEVDGSYDLCNEAWARGEADKFRSPELIPQISRRMLIYKLKWIDLNGFVGFCFPIWFQTSS